MSNQGFPDQNQSNNPYQQNAPPAHSFQSNNPWAEQSGHPPAEHQQYQQQPLQPQAQQQYSGYQPPPGPPPSHSPNPWQLPESQSQYAPPSGPPPGHDYQQQGPRRSETFREADFVPEAERGEQREAMQQFEMNRSGQAKSQQDRDLEALQKDFPSIDSSLIAALYADAGSAGATREMLVELDGK